LPLPSVELLDDRFDAWGELGEGLERPQGGGRGPLPARACSNRPAASSSERLFPSALQRSGLRPVSIGDAERGTLRPDQ
jgi:hypothetical protein